MVDFQWQVQEAKQRFSEVLRRAHDEGPQVVTKHGKEVAVVMDIAEYNRMRERRPTIKEVLLGGPPWDDEFIEIMDQVVADRKLSYPREIDFGDE